MSETEQADLQSMREMQRALVAVAEALGCAINKSTNTYDVVDAARRAADELTDLRKRLADPACQECGPICTHEHLRRKVLAMDLLEKKASAFQSSNARLSALVDQVAALQREACAAYLERQQGEHWQRAAKLVCRVHLVTDAK